MQQLRFANCVKAVHEFHLKFGINVSPLDNESVADLRIKRQKEEIDELNESETLADAADAIIDIVYIAAGTVALLGERTLETERLSVNPHLVASQLRELFNRVTWLGRTLPLQDLWDEVHKANMRKVRGTEQTSKYGNSFDVVKPEGWTPPDIASVLRLHKINPAVNPKKYFGK